MRVEPLKREHLAGILLQPQQEAWAGGLRPEDWEALSVNGWTVFLDDRAIACGGFIDLGGGRATAWALIPADVSPRALVALTRAAKRGLEIAPFRRVSAEVARNFQPGRRWVQLLGFEFEGVMRGWCDGGGDAELWAKVS